ncbi:wnk protein kinase, partial [Nannochloropsis oceanica]
RRRRRRDICPCPSSSSRQPLWPSPKISVVSTL